ncbi:MAG TPA: hypothetical protein VMH40_05325, partial [Myxococcaceae bacterium]|nr:hypothetical protein [Myxococcaceae bacterium]
MGRPEPGRGQAALRRRGPRGRRGRGAAREAARPGPVDGRLRGPACRVGGVLRGAVSRAWPAVWCGCAGAPGERRRPAARLEPAAGAVGRRGEA